MVHGSDVPVRTLVACNSWCNVLPTSASDSVLTPPPHPCSTTATPCSILNKLKTAKDKTLAAASAAGQKAKALGDKLVDTIRRDDERVREEQEREEEVRWPGLLQH